MDTVDGGFALVRGRGDDDDLALIDLQSGTATALGCLDDYNSLIPYQWYPGVAAPVLVLNGGDPDVWEDDQFAFFDHAGDPLPIDVPDDVAARAVASLDDAVVRRRAGPTTFVVSAHHWF